eukprot:GFKZ01001281.1.p1 GENE.GFKZ01001281.1~~GFKZ01001281.1.p1  ORF type:complete len:383 (+),score=73.65 GFKZ01001281.1:260-1408(+)
MRARVCSLFVLLALISLTWPSATLAFQFYLQAGERRCFTESAPPNTKVLAEYTVSTGRGKMPVDIVVRMERNQRVLYERQNVDHGKFAFIVPFDDHEMPHVKQAELHRKLLERMRHSMRKPKEGTQPNAATDHKSVHSRRRLLGVDDKVPPPPPPPPKSAGSAPDVHPKAPAAGDMHKEDSAHYRHRHHYYRDGHEHHPHDDDDDEEYDDYDYEDELDDFEMDDYEGIDDQELDEELERKAQKEERLHGRFDDASDSEKEDRLFDQRKFEICVISAGDRTGHKRRVRIVINKGDTAHDYTRLAKKEHMTQLEVSLRQVSEELHELMHELDQARSMEDILRVRNEGTNKRVVILSITSLFFLFSVGAYQAFYTKRFFKRKKIL